MFDLLAYIDPGTGAIVLQVIIAAVFSATLLFRRLFISPFAFVGRSLNRFLGKSKQNEDESSDDS